MGQYHKAINLDRLEYLEPSAFGDGDKLTEFALSAGGMMSALAALLAASSGRGFGDLHSRTEARPGLMGQDEWLAECGYTAELIDGFMLGRWAGDRIAIVGDYFDELDLDDWGYTPELVEDGKLEMSAGGPFGNDRRLWTDISRLGIVLIGLEESMRDEAREMLGADAGVAVAAVSDEQLRGFRPARI